MKIFDFFLYRTKDWLTFLIKIVAICKFDYLQILIL